MRALVVIHVRHARKRTGRIRFSGFMHLLCYLLVDRVLTLSWTATSHLAGILFWRRESRVPLSKTIDHVVQLDDSETAQLSFE
jgi:hypothetical protein